MELSDTCTTNAISGKQFLTLDNLQINYEVLSCCKNDFSRFDEEKFIKLIAAYVAQRIKSCWRPGQTGHQSECTAVTKFNSVFCKEKQTCF